MRYRKKPVVIEAMRWDGSLKSTDDITHWCGGRYGYEVKPSDHTDHEDGSVVGADVERFEPVALVAFAEVHSASRISSRVMSEWIEIPTLEGVMRASVGDWIIRGVKGEFYPCRDDIFHQTYEPVGGDA